MMKGFLLSQVNRFRWIEFDFTLIIFFTLSCLRNQTENLGGVCYGCRVDSVCLSFKYSSVFWAIVCIMLICCTDLNYSKNPINLFGYWEREESKEFDCFMNSQSVFCCFLGKKLPPLNCNGVVNK